MHRMGKRKGKKPGPPPSKGKDPVRSLRVPDAEWEAWKKKAAKAGLSLSMWLRRLANSDQP
jgi:predicted DNA binding CopG/RHH family protein